MKAIRVCEIICAVALVVFLAVVISDSSGGSKKTAQEIFAPVLTAAANDKLEEASNETLKKNLGLNAGDFEGLVYYTNPEIMDVSELLVIKLKDESQGEGVLSAIDGYATTQSNIFNGYGENQSELLKNRVCLQSGNCILFAVSENSQQIKDAFNKAL